MRPILGSLHVVWDECSDIGSMNGVAAFHLVCMFLWCGRIRICQYKGKIRPFSPVWECEEGNQRRKEGGQERQNGQER